jgi:uncharacterized phage protein gp47/JayE
MTFDEIYNSIITDWCNKLNIPVTDAGYNIIVLSKVISLGLYLIIKIVDGIKNNVWVGSMQASKLLEVGQDKIGRGLFQAIKGEYLCSTTVKGGGGDIPLGSIFTIEINGVISSYESTSLVAGGDDVPIRALEAGTASALVVSDKLTSKQNLTYAENEITVLSITETPVDTETIEEYRAVVVQAEILRLGNGNASDYKLWVANVNGLKTSYPYTAVNEAGKAKIYCESTDSEVLVPSAGLIDDAIDSIKYDINGKSQPPVEFFEFVNTSYVLPVQITGIKIQVQNGDTGQTSTIESLIRAYLLIKRPFLHTVNKLITVSEGLNTLENTVALVDIVQLLANADITFDSIVMQVDILNSTGYAVLSKYVVGYRGGSTYPSELLPGNDPALPTYYGECPRLELVEFI